MSFMMPINHSELKKRISYLKQGRDKKGRFKKKKLIYRVWGRIKKWFGFLIILFILHGCSKYQVVSEVNVNLYHMHNPRTNKMEIILTEQKLEIGNWYRLKSIKQVEIDDKNIR